VEQEATRHPVDNRFVGRKKELELLEAAYRSPGSAFIPVYGRRRVGKSELILRFLKKKDGIYFLGKKAPAEFQIREFLREAAASLGEPLLASVRADGWQDALEAVSTRWNAPRKLVLVLYEFQWAVEASPELPSLLQGLWERLWKPVGNVFLILCGSYVGFMEREVLGKKSPLFGRRTAQIFLQPFPYLEAAAFHPSYGWEDRAKTYFLCGGVPQYLLCFRPDRSVEMNVADNFLDEFAPLYREPDFLLREELREVEKYYGILLAVAAGHRTNNAISRQTGIGERSLHYYLKQLTELGYLSRRYPVTGGRPVLRHVRYALEDPLLSFWFRFVYPNTSFILQMGPQRAIRERIRPELPAYFGRCFEKLCREALPFLYAREGVSAAFEVGEYWNRGTQIDVVGHRDDGWVDLGECKWGAVSSAPQLEQEIEAKVGRYPNPQNLTVGRRIFTRRPVTGSADRDGRIRWHHLEELYALQGA